MNSTIMIHSITIPILRTALMSIEESSGVDVGLVVMDVEVVVVVVVVVSLGGVVVV